MTHQNIAILMHTVFGWDSLFRQTQYRPRGRTAPEDGRPMDVHEARMWCWFLVLPLCSTRCFREMSSCLLVSLVWIVKYGFWCFFSWVRSGFLYMFPMHYGYMIIPIINRWWRVGIAISHVDSTKRHGNSPANAGLNQLLKGSSFWCSMPPSPTV